MITEKSLVFVNIPVVERNSEYRPCQCPPSLQNPYKWICPDTKCNFIHKYFAGIYLFIDLVMLTSGFTQKTIDRPRLTKIRILIQVQVYVILMSIPSFHHRP